RSTMRPVSSSRNSLNSLKIVPGASNRNGSAVGAISADRKSGKPAKMPSPVSCTVTGSLGVPAGGDVAGDREGAAAAGGGEGGRAGPNADALPSKTAQGGVLVKPRPPLPVDGAG